MPSHSQQALCRAARCLIPAAKVEFCGDILTAVIEMIADERRTWHGSRRVFTRWRLMRPPLTCAICVVAAVIFGV